MSDVNRELAELLRDMRHKAGLTRAVLALRLGYAADTTIYQYESGRLAPKPELIGRWAAACGFLASIVVNREDDVGTHTWAVKL